MPDNYDVQQVCENGHQITGCYNFKPNEREKYCQKCGATTIAKCPDCGIEIRGSQIYVIQRLRDRSTGQPKINSTPVDIPSYCLNCGKPYPWTKNKIETAIQILTEYGKLDDQEKKTIEQDINNIAKDVPQAELSAMRIKRIWDKCKSAGYEVIMEFASRTAAKILKEQ